MYTSHMGFSLVPSPRAPPGENQSGEQSQIFGAYYQTDKRDCELGNYYVALPFISMF